MRSSPRATRTHPTWLAPVSRAVVLVGAVLQLLAPGALALADGWSLASGDSTAVPAVHVEAPGHKGCPRVHDPATCVACQFLAHAAGLNAAPAPWIAPTAAVLPLYPRGERRYAPAAVRTTVLPRAPPIA